MKNVLKALILPLTFCAALAQADDQTKLRIATEGTYPPFSYLENGELTGFDVDIAKALCEKMKAQCTVVSQEWDGMIPGLMSGKFDAIVASMNVTEERKKKIDFSDKYYATPARFITVKDSGITDVTPAGLDGKTVGVQVSTTQANYLEAKYPKAIVKQYKTVDDATMDLANGRLDTVFSDSAILYTWMKGKDGGCCAFVGQDIKDESVFGIGKGVGIRKEDQALKAKFNDAIKAILADGTYQKINAKYFPFSIY